MSPQPTEDLPGKPPSRLRENLNNSVGLKARAASWEATHSGPRVQSAYHEPVDLAAQRSASSLAAKVQAAASRQRSWLVLMAVFVAASVLLLLTAAGRGNLLMRLPSSGPDTIIIPIDQIEEARWQAVLAELAAQDQSPTSFLVELQLLQKQDVLTRGASKEQRLAARILGPGFGSSILSRPVYPKTPKGRTQMRSPDMLAMYKAVMMSPAGRMARVNSTLSMPLGFPNASNPLCHPLLNKTAKSIAVVGNGPLSQEDRRSIETKDVIIRMNLMNNWLRFKERVDVWVARFSFEASQRYWGFSNFAKPDANRVVDMLKAVWLVGGTQEDADSLAGIYPALDAKAAVLVAHEALILQYSRSVEDDQASPSTGFVAILAALHCSHPDAVLHIYGMNWPKSLWSGHKGYAEEAFVRAMEALKRIQVHAAACAGLRECGDGDVDGSCHWDNHRKYMCLLSQDGQGRRWTDMTHKVPAARQKELQPVS